MLQVAVTHVKCCWNVSMTDPAQGATKIKMRANLLRDTTAWWVRCFYLYRFVPGTHPAVQPVLTHHTLNHLILHLDAEPSKKRNRDLTTKPEDTWCTGEVQVRLSCASHLVLWVWVRPAAGAVLSKEVMTVFVQTVDLLLLLKHTRTRKHCRYNIYNFMI